jgi:hypothetical protein
MRIHNGLFLVTALVWLSVILPPVPAQTTTGSIVGTVSDPSGGAVAGARVAVANEGTGIVAITLVTDSSGNYVATTLPPGRYSVTVEATGFKKSVSPGINLSVQDRIGVNVVLEVGQVTETVEVVGAAQALQTDSSYLGQVVDGKRIAELPLNGRYFTRLVMLTSGTLPTAPGARDERTGGFSSNGVRPYQNSYLLDGIDNNSLSQDLTNEASFVYGPSPDAIAEFRVQTNSMSAEFGRSGGAVMNVNIKSGANGFHGTAFEFLRNDALDARNFFAGNTKPEYRLNQFGAAAGGPVRKNQTFFFVDYQGTRQRTGQTFLSTVAPTAWRTGDYGGFNPVLDPVTKQAFPNNRIPASAFDPAAVKLIALMPAPTVPGSVSFTGVANNYLINPVEPSRTDQGDVRVDHHVSTKDSFFTRFSMSNQELSPPSPIPPPLAGAQFASGDWTNNTRSAVVSETHIFSSHVINEFRIGYTRLRSERLQFNASENLSAQVGIPGIPFTPGNGGLPRFDVSGVTSFGGATFQPTREFENVVHLIDTLSIIKARHTFKFGFEDKPKVDFSILQPPTPRGRFGFTGNFTRDTNNRANTGLGFADFILGRTDNTRVSSFINDTFQQPGYFFYAQDDIKLTSHLTLNLGIRYEFITHPTERRDAQASFNVANGSLEIVSGRNDPLPSNFFTQVPVTRNAPRQLVPQDRNNWAPRVGFALQITPKTVIRSGYGIFYSSYEAGPLSIPNPGNNPPFYLESRWDPVTFGVPNLDVNQLSRGLPLDAFAKPVAPALFSLDPGFRNPYVQHWNFNIQRNLGWDTVWEVAYAGSAGKKLYEFLDANAPTPTADASIATNARRALPFLGGSLTYWCSCNSSTYHSLQTKAEKRFSQGLTFLAAYTWGRAIDEVSQASLGFNNSVGFRDQRNRRAEKARSDYDIAHRLVISYSYELPLGRNLKGPAKTLLDGWQILGAHGFNTGNPYTISARTNFSNAGGDTRPDVIPGVTLEAPGGRHREQWFNPAAFRNPAAGNWGNAGRNIDSQPGLISVDFSVFKNFRITEDKRLQFRTEVFNLPNHPNFRGLSRSFDASNPGELTSAAAGRQVQFALKLRW